MKIKQLTFKDLDEMMEYNENHSHQIHLQTFKSLRNEWNKNKKTTDVDVFQIFFEDDEEYEDMLLTIYANEWEHALEIALEFFEDNEEYELCTKINKLLTTIKTKQLCISK
jgi:hypothetical protein